MDHTITSHGICQVSIAPLRAAASDESEISTQLLFGDYVKVLETRKPWVKVYFSPDQYEGWMDFKQLHYISQDEYHLGVNQVHEVVRTGLLKVNGPLGYQHLIFGSNLPFLSENNFKIGNIKCTVEDEIISFNESFIDTSFRYLNTPYLWGGKGILGIDCSGFVQIVAKVHGISLPRDASQQVEYGELIEFEERQAGDLIYFTNLMGKVHHLGIVINEKEIIHASGHVRIDSYNQKGIYRSDLAEYTHNFHNIKRIWSK